RWASGVGVAAVGGAGEAERAALDALQADRVARQARLALDVFVARRGLGRVLERARLAGVALLGADARAAAEEIEVAVVVSDARLAFQAALHASGHVVGIVGVTRRQAGRARDALHVVV